MRILTLSNSPLDPARGSGYVVCGYCERLARRGHQVRVLGPPDFEPGYGWPRAIRWRQALGMALATRRERALADYDVIEIYGGEAWLAISWLRRVAHRRFLVVSHSNGLETHLVETLREAESAGATGLRRRWFRPRALRLYEHTFRRADGLVMVSDFDHAYARARAYQPQARLLSLENPLPDAFLDQPIDLARPPVLGFCGSWLPIKGIETLVRDATRLLAELPAWRLMLVGVGEGFRVELAFPHDLLSRIEVVPHADRMTELPALYRRMAILAMPSLYESFGLVAAEAMAHGCAVVATRVGFPASLVDGEEVLHLEAKCSPALYQAARRLMADEGLRRAVARGGWRRAQSLRWEGAVDRLEAAYETWRRALAGGRW